MERPRIKLSKEELDRAKIPLNHILVKMLHTSEGIKTKGGITIGFNLETVYAEGDNSWCADLAECYAETYKVPDNLFYDPDDPNTMDIDTDMELQVGDMVWFSILESKNSPEVICDGELYKSLPYADCYVAKRIIKEEPPITGRIGSTFTFRLPLNGYVLCEPCYESKLSDLDTLSEKKADMTRGVIKFIGTPPKGYIREEYTHIDDLRVEDEVLFDPRTALFYLERSKSLAKFDGDNQYWCVPRRRIVTVLNRK